MFSICDAVTYNSPCGPQLSVSGQSKRSSAITGSMFLVSGSLHQISASRAKKRQRSGEEADRLSVSFFVLSLVGEDRSLRSMIKRVLGFGLIQCCFVLPICCAADAPPVEASIKQLLEISHVKKLVESMETQMDGLMKNAMAQATQGQQLSPATQKEVDEFETATAAEMRSILDWSKLETMYVRIYQKSFNQQEIDGMLVFYKTPTGQAVLNKMPLVLQNTMVEVQGMLQPMMQHLQQKQQEIAAKVQAEKKKSG